MKIGILTYHKAHNYGAVLQAYASMIALNRLGHRAEMIDYTPKSVSKAYSLFFLRHYRRNTPKNIIKTLAINTLTFRRRALRRRGFDKFINKNMVISKKNFGSKFPDTPKGYDAVYIGSDQVWKERIAADGYRYYWGDFVKAEGQKVIAYAPSMEVEKLSEEQQRYCKEHLENFDYLSVRENELLELLQPLTDKPIHLVADPTLLLDAHDYDQITEKTKIGQEYVLLYQVGSFPIAREVAEEISKITGLKIVEIMSSVNLRKEKDRLDCASPSEFLGLIKNAKFIVTTSFHGTVFSTIFQKPFYAVGITGLTTRLSTLLGSLDIEDRLITKVSDIDARRLYNIDYGKVNTNRKIMRAKSLEYLNKTLKNE